MKTVVIMLAGGKGERMGSPVNKVLIPVCGKPVIIRSLFAFVPYADEFIIAARPDDQPVILAELEKSGLSFPFRFAEAGRTRQGSVLNALRAISADPQDIILIHDAARCLVSSSLIERIILSVRENGTGIPGIPASSTFKTVSSDSFVVNTPERASLFEIQTPQGFTAETIIPASVRAAEEGIDCTDDAGICEYYHIPVKVVPGDSSNIKLTEPRDLFRARNILEGDVNSMRIGMGYDVHRLVAGRKLVLCGEEIPYEFGLLGHSDADVALHALMDAMLGACSLGDIGKHFPDTDDCFTGISSITLLKETSRILNENGYTLYNADITIAAQKPKLLPYIPHMKKNIADALELPQDRISVKATTTENLGFEGRMEGISSYAVCTVIESEKE